MSLMARSRGSFKRYSATSSFWSPYADPPDLAFHELQGIFFAIEKTFDTGEMEKGLKPSLLWLFRDYLSVRNNLRKNGRKSGSGY